MLQQFSFPFEFAGVAVAAYRIAAIVAVHLMGSWTTLASKSLVVLDVEGTLQAEKGVNWALPVVVSAIPEAG